MSGGIFNYDQSHIRLCADEIERLIENNGKETVRLHTGSNAGGPVYYPEYTPETLMRFREAVTVLKLAEVFAHRIDWLVSGDDSEESFHQRLTEELEAMRDEIEAMEGAQT